MKKNVKKQIILNFMMLSKKQIFQFQKTIYDYYTIWGRPFAWRNTTNPYHIFVSEVMLQQTQTQRVKVKYEQFIDRFPDFASLANASLYDLLQVWQGLGYNRRAISLQKSAQIIMQSYNGVVPRESELLLALPGIGKATAASIPAFAYNVPTVFIETNIRVVFMHFFFQEQISKSDGVICDKELFPLVEQTLDKKNPREWYYAIMDYGVKLKAQGINPIHKSKQYHKQSKFVGSDRQIRGALLRILIANKSLTVDEVVKKLQKLLKATPVRVEKVIDQLVKEQFIIKKQNVLVVR